MHHFPAISSLSCFDSTGDTSSITPHRWSSDEDSIMYDHDQAKTPLDVLPVPHATVLLQDELGHGRTHSAGDLDEAESTAQQERIMSSWFTPSHAVKGFPMIPKPKFGLGHAGFMMSDEPFAQQMAHFSVDHADANGRVCFWMGRIPAVSVSHARDVQHVLKWSSSREVFPLMKVHFEACLGKRNIGILSGKEWKAQRNRVVQALHTAMRQQDVSKAVLQTSHELVSGLLQNLADASTGSSVTRDVAPLMRMLALDAFGRSALHVDFACTKNLRLSEVAAAFDHLTEDMMRRIMTIGGAADPTSYLYNLPTPRNAAHKKHKAVVRDCIEGEVERRRANGTQDMPQDILTQLLKVKEEHIDNEAEVEAMTDTLVALLFAGFETTATTLTFAIYMISQHPAVEDALLKEIEEHPPTAESDPSDYPYLEAVLKETLRLYPPAISTTRSLDKPITLDEDTIIPEGTYLYVPIYLIQRDPQHFERPDEFIPERWLQDSALSVHDEGAFVAFSAGARSCPGRRFAFLEMTLSLAVLLRSFRFTAVDDYVLEPVRNKMTLEPKGGIPMVIQQRVAA